MRILFSAVLFFGLGVTLGGEIQSRSMVSVIASEVEAQTARLAAIANTQAEMNQTLGCTMKVLDAEISDLE